MKKMHEEKKKLTGCQRGPEYFSHLHQKEKLREAGKDMYFQICTDDEGHYTVSHSINPDDDLVDYDKIPPQKLMLETWKAMFGNTPSDWPQDLSVMSYFERKRWAKIKKMADKWRN
jgi:hypothetical protein